MKEENVMQIAVKTAAEVAAAALYERTRKGYTVGTRSFLYKLTWNDSISDIFYTDYWVDESMSIDDKKLKKDLFDNTDLFTMEFVGMEKATVMVLNLKAENLTTQQIIGEATIRTGNKVFAKLQKEYDVFKPKTPNTIFSLTYTKTKMLQLTETNLLVTQYFNGIAQIKQV